MTEQKTLPELLDTGKCQRFLELGWIQAVGDVKDTYDYQAVDMEEAQSESNRAPWVLSDSLHQKAADLGADYLGPINIDLTTGCVVGHFEAKATCYKDTR